MLAVVFVDEINESEKISKEISAKKELRMAKKHILQTTLWGEITTRPSDQN